LDDVSYFYFLNQWSTSVGILAWGLGMFISTNNLFVTLVCDSLGISWKQFAFHRTIITLVSACLMALYGKLIRRLGVRKMLAIGFVLLGLVTFCYSLQTAFGLFMCWPCERADRSCR
jgi:uncharacterized membrane protein YdjX (TVP38/TMEM64 family)